MKQALAFLVFFSPIFLLDTEGTFIVLVLAFLFLQCTHGFRRGSFRE